MFDDLDQYRTAQRPEAEKAFGGGLRVLLLVVIGGAILAAVWLWKSK